MRGGGRKNSTLTIDGVPRPKEKKTRQWSFDLNRKAWNRNDTQKLVGFRTLSKKKNECSFLVSYISHFLSISNSVLIFFFSFFGKNEKRNILWSKIPILFFFEKDKNINWYTAPSEKSMDFFPRKKMQTKNKSCFPNATSYVTIARTPLYREIEKRQQFFSLSIHPSMEGGNCHDLCVLRTVFPKVIFSDSFLG